MVAEIATGGGFDCSDVSVRSSFSGEDYRGKQVIIRGHLRVVIRGHLRVVILVIRGHLRVGSFKIMIRELKKKIGIQEPHESRHCKDKSCLRDRSFLEPRIFGCILKSHIEDFLIWLSIKGGKNCYY